MNMRKNFGRLATLLLATVCAFQTTVLWMPVESEAKEAPYFGQVAIGTGFAACLHPDGSVRFSENAPGKADNWEKLTQIGISSTDSFYGLDIDGMLHTTHPQMQSTVEAWKDIKAFSVYSDQTGSLEYGIWGELVAAVTKKGRVYIAASGDYDTPDGVPQMDVSGWTKIASVAVGGGHIVGLRSDGTVVATGNNKYGQCDVKKWKDIVSVCAGAYCTVGLKSDGTVTVTGDAHDFHITAKQLQEKVKSWKHVEKISVCCGRIYGLTSDGKVLGFDGKLNNSFNYACFGPIRENWVNMASFFVGPSGQAGFRQDGTMIMDGGNMAFEPRPCSLMDVDWPHGNLYDGEKVTCYYCEESYAIGKDDPKNCAHYWIAFREWDTGSNFFNDGCEYLCLKCGKQIIYSPVMLTELERKADSDASGKKKDITYGDWECKILSMVEDSIRFWVMRKEGYDDTEWVEIKLNREYQTLEFLTDITEDSNADASDLIFRVYGDGKSLGTVQSENGWAYGKVNVEGVNVLRISCTNTSAKEGWGVFCGRLHYAIDTEPAA